MGEGVPPPSHPTVHLTLTPCGQGSRIQAWVWTEAIAGSEGSRHVLAEPEP